MGTSIWELINGPSFHLGGRNSIHFVVKGSRAAPPSPSPCKPRCEGARGSSQALQGAGHWAGVPTQEQPQSSPSVPSDPDGRFSRRSLSGRGADSRWRSRVVPPKSHCLGRNWALERPWSPGPGYYLCNVTFTHEDTGVPGAPRWVVEQV